MQQHNPSTIIRLHFTRIQHSQYAGSWGLVYNKHISHSWSVAVLLGGLTYFTKDFHTWCVLSHPTNAEKRHTFQFRKPSNCHTEILDTGYCKSRILAMLYFWLYLEPQEKDYSNDTKLKWWWHLALKIIQQNRYKNWTVPTVSGNMISQKAEQRTCLFITLIFLVSSCTHCYRPLFFTLLTKSVLHWYQCSHFWMSFKNWQVWGGSHAFDHNIATSRIQY